LNDKLIQSEILYINNFLLINVDVSATTGAFVRMVCLIRTAIRQTIPTKAPVEAEKSTLFNKRLFY